MDILEELRKLFGLADDADEQTILDAVTAAKDASEAATEASSGAGGVAASAAPTDSVTVSAVAFSSLQATVAQLQNDNAELTAAATAKRRDEIIATALSEGRLTPPETKPWRDALDAAEESTVALLATRTPVFNTVELGHTASLSATDKAKSDALTAAEDEAFGIK